MTPDELRQQELSHEQHIASLLDIRNRGKRPRWWDHAGLTALLGSVSAAMITFAGSYVLKNHEFAAQQRMAGAFSDAATFREQGIDNWVSSWRGMFAPKGTGPAPVAFWEGALGKMAASDEWNKQLAANEWHPQFLRSAEFTKYLEVQHNANRAIMAEVGLVK